MQVRTESLMRMAAMIAGCMANLGKRAAAARIVVRSPAGIRVLLGLLEAVTRFPQQQFLREKTEETLASLLATGEEGGGRPVGAGATTGGVPDESDDDDEFLLGAETAVLRADLDIKQLALPPPHLPGCALMVPFQNLDLRGVSDVIL